MRKAAIVVIAVLCAVLLLGRGSAPGPSTAPASRTLIGPEGGSISAGVRNPKNASELYAVTRGYPGCVYRSANGGAGWTRTATLLVHTFDLALDSKNPSNIIVLSMDSIHKSKDGGATFTAHPFGSSLYADGGRLAVHPSNPSIMYVAGFYILPISTYKTCMAVFKTVNGGTTWTFNNFESGYNRGWGKDIVMSAKDPNTIYMCGTVRAGDQDLGRIFRSSNGGASWSQLPGSFDSDPKVIAVGLADADIVYIGTQGGICKRGF